MRIWVTGARGMLGRAVAEEARRAGHDVAATGHEVPVDDHFAGHEALWMRPPDVVVNCAGRLPGTGPDMEMVSANALGPHVLAGLAQVWGAHLVHVSCDRVFSGWTPRGFPGWRYGVTDVPDPRDLYGCTKRAGEVRAGHVTVVRTAFIGPDHGLLRWFLDEAEAGREVDGWQGVSWTGSTVWAVARALVAIAEAPPGGIVHLATAEKLDRCQVLRAVRDALGLEVEVRPVPEPRVDRALEPTVALPPLDEALAELSERLAATVAG